MTLKYIPLMLLVVVISFIIHEGAHYAMGVALGYDMQVSINKAGLASGSYTSSLHQQLVSIAGPVVTFLIAAIALWLAYTRKIKAAFLFVFSGFLMRLMAAGVSVANPNDEARVSEALGWSMWALPGIVVGALFVMSLLASRTLGLGWKSWALTWVVMSVGIVGIIFTEPYWPVVG
jgi:hypothetical protein